MSVILYGYAIILMKAYGLPDLLDDERMAVFIYEAAVFEVRRFVDGEVREEDFFVVVRMSLSAGGFSSVIHSEGTNFAAY